MNNNKINPYNTPTRRGIPPKERERPLYNKPITDDMVPNQVISQHVPKKPEIIPQKTDIDTVPVKFDPKTGRLFVPGYPNYDNYFKDALNYMDAFTNKLPIFKVEKTPLEENEITSAISETGLGNGVYIIESVSFGPEFVIVNGNRYTRYNNEGISILEDSGWDSLGISIITEYQHNSDKIKETFSSLKPGIYIAETYFYGKEIWIKHVAYDKRITANEEFFRMPGEDAWSPLYVKYSYLFSEDGKIRTSRIPQIAITQTYPVRSIEEMLQLEAQQGDVAIISGVGSYILQNNDPTQLENWLILVSPMNAVLSVNGMTGTVELKLEHLPDAEAKLNKIKEEAIAEAIKQIEDLDIQTKNSPTRDFLVKSTYIEELDSEGNIIDIYDKVVDVSEDYYETMMEYFRDILGLGSLNIDFVPNGKQGARGRFLFHPDYLEGSFGFQFLNLFGRHLSISDIVEFDSLVVECIGAKETASECTMIIDIYDKSSNHYNIQICANYDKSTGITNYVSNGLSTQSSELELIYLNEHDSDGVIPLHLSRKIYENPSKYLIKININYYNTYLHYKEKDEENGDTWWEYQIIDGELEYIENGVIYINKDGPWGFDDRFNSYVGPRVINIDSNSASDNGHIYYDIVFKDPENVILVHTIPHVLTKTSFVYNFENSEKIYYIGSCISEYDYMVNRTTGLCSVTIEVDKITKNWKEINLYYVELDQYESEEAILTKVVPRRLESIPVLTKIKPNEQYIFVDDNGTDAKISIQEINSRLLKTVDTVPEDMVAGEYIFKKI